MGGKTVIKVLNLYAGIGGNRKLWTDVDVTAVEFDAEIAGLYKIFHPNDTVVIDDAHTYLEKHWREFDFIWSSPPCQSHSKIRMMASKHNTYDAIMPNMNLWSEIIFLQNFTKGTDIKFVVENVRPYYNPLVAPTIKLGRHMLWTNFDIPYIDMKDGVKHTARGYVAGNAFDLRSYKIKHRKDQIVRNCVDPKIGEYVLKCVVGGR